LHFGEALTGGMDLVDEISFGKGHYDYLRIDENGNKSYRKASSKICTKLKSFKKLSHICSIP